MTIEEYHRVCKKLGLHFSVNEPWYGYYNYSDDEPASWLYITYFSKGLQKVQLRYNAFSIIQKNESLLFPNDTKPFLNITTSFIYVSDPKTLEYFLGRTINKIKQLNNELKKRLIADDFVE